MPHPGLAAQDSRPLLSRPWCHVLGVTSLGVTSPVVTSPWCHVPGVTSLVSRPLVSRRGSGQVAGPHPRAVLTRLGSACEDRSAAGPGGCKPCARRSEDSPGAWPVPGAWWIGLGRGLSRGPWGVGYGGVAGRHWRGAGTRVGGGRTEPRSLGSAQPGPVV